MQGRSEVLSDRGGASSGSPSVTRGSHIAATDATQATAQRRSTGCFQGGSVPPPPPPPSRSAGCPLQSTARPGCAPRTRQRQKYARWRRPLPRRSTRGAHQRGTAARGAASAAPARRAAPAITTATAVAAQHPRPPPPSVQPAPPPGTIGWQKTWSKGAGWGRAWKRAGARRPDMRRGQPRLRLRRCIAGRGRLAAEKKKSERHGMAGKGSEVRKMRKG